MSVKRYEAGCQPMPVSEPLLQFPQGLVRFPHDPIEHSFTAECRGYDLLPGRQARASPGCSLERFSRPVTSRSRISDVEPVGLPL